MGHNGMRICHFSDLHLSARRPFFQHNFEIFRESLAGEPADLVLCTGDMSLDGADDSAELAYARSQIDRLGREVLVVPGNHDIGNSLPDVRGSEITISAERRDTYLRVFGADFWVRDIGSWRVVGLNTMLPGSSLPAAAVQDQMLEAAVKGLDGRGLIIAGHKPLYLNEAAETVPTQGALFPEHRRKWLDLFHSVGTVTYLCGHKHEMKDMCARNVRQVWAPSTAFVMDMANLFQEPASANPISGVKRPGYLWHVASSETVATTFVEPAGFLIVDLGNWFRDPRGFHGRYAREPWRGIAAATSDEPTPSGRI